MWYALISFLVPLITYIFFLAPTIVGGDTGELITSAYALGIPHPPGYPLYMILGKIFTYLPFNSIAWRVNLLSAVLSAFTVLLVYLSLRMVTRNNLAALCGGLSLAFSRFFWHYSEVAEVFPLNNFFAALLIYLLLLYREAYLKGIAIDAKILKSDPLKVPGIKYLYLLAFLYGIGLSNHHTLILLFPALVYFIYSYQKPLVFSCKFWLICLGLLLSGLLVYLYAPLAALRQPLINWDNPVNWNNFLNMILRKDFGSLSLFSKEAGMVAPSRLIQIPPYLAGFYQQFNLIGLGLGLLGIYSGLIVPWMTSNSASGKRDLKKSKPRTEESANLPDRNGLIFNIFLLIAFIFTGLFFVLFANMPIQKVLLLGVLHRFYLLSAVIFAFWIGLGFNKAVQISGKWPPWVKFCSPWVLLVSCIYLLFAANYKEADFRNNYLAYDVGKNILDSLPPNSLLFVHGDVASMAVDYLQMAEKYRTDVITLDQEKLTYPWFVQQVTRRYPELKIAGVRYDGVNLFNVNLIDDNINRYPIFFSDFKERSFERKYREIPWGLVVGISPLGQQVDSQEVENHVLGMLNSFSLRGIERDYPRISFEYEIKGLYAWVYFNLAFFEAKNQNFDKALVNYSKALGLNPEMAPAYKNQAIIYLNNMRDLKNAGILFKKYLQLSPGDQDRPQIEALIKQAGL